MRKISTKGRRVVKIIGKTVGIIIIGLLIIEITQVIVNFDYLKRLWELSRPLNGEIPKY